MLISLGTPAPTPDLDGAIETSVEHMGPEISAARDAATSQHDHGVVDGDMDLELVVRQGWRDVRVAMAVFTREGRTETRARYIGMMALVSSLDHSGRKFRREATGQLRAIVSEIYSAPRVRATAARHPREGMIPRIALDLITTTSEGLQ